MEQKHETHLPMVGNGSKSVSEFRPNIDFLRMANRLRGSTNVNLRENVDVRLFFRCENTFLVKAFFTFGLRNVEIGTAHIYQTLNVPLLFYVKNRFSKEKKATRQFPYGELCKYQRFVLSPNKCFRIPPGLTYMILSTQKNYFSVDIVPENYQIEIEYENPLIKRVSKFHDSFHRPFKFRKGRVNIFYSRIAGRPKSRTVQRLPAKNGTVNSTTNGTVKRSFNLKFTTNGAVK